jgi:hypothetical protein
MRDLVVRLRNSGHTTTICTYDEDIRCWYAVEIKSRKIVDTTHYSKIEFDFMGVK